MSISRQYRHLNGQKTKVNKTFVQKTLKIDYFNIFGTKQAFFGILLMFLPIFIAVMKNRSVLLGWNSLKSQRRGNLFVDRKLNVKLAFSFGEYSVHHTGSLMILAGRIR